MTIYWLFNQNLLMVLANRLLTNFLIEVLSSSDSRKVFLRLPYLFGERPMHSQSSPFVVCQSRNPDFIWYIVPQCSSY